jgi:hypothetical protein
MNVLPPSGGEQGKHGISTCKAKGFDADSGFNE